ncbi:UNVERIFIED_CONTAM: dinucleotide-utilizing enzyme [Microbacterium sp. SLM126]
MPTRPRLVRSIPFWALVAASVATAVSGAVLLVDKLGIMTTTLTDGSATGVEVYVGQSVAGLGAILLGAGIVGILISLAVAAAASLRPLPPVEVVEPIDWSADSVDEADAPVDEAVVADEADAAELTATR